MQTTPDFSLEKGLEVQHSQLKRWKKVLKKKMYYRLSLWIDEQNKLLNEHSNGYHVIRGIHIDEYVFNTLMNIK